MARYQTIVQLTDELVRRLDKEAARRGVSRSALVRDAITEYLAASTEAADIARWAEGYAKIPPGTPDEWGDLDASGDRQTRETLRRLREEEIESGSGTW